MKYYVERGDFEGRVVWLEIASGLYKEWYGCFCLLDGIPAEHVPAWDAGMYSYER